MIKRYKIPIMGKVKQNRPLKGDSGNPICAIPLSELPNCPGEGYSYRALEYDLENECVEIELSASEQFHEWLSGFTQKQLKDHAKVKGYKLTKAVKNAV